MKDENLDESIDDIGMPLRMFEQSWGSRRCYDTDPFGDEKMKVTNYKSVYEELKNGIWIAALFSVDFNGVVVSGFAYVRGPSRPKIMPPDGVRFTDEKTEWKIIRQCLRREVDLEMEEIKAQSNRSVGHEF